jgi:hypothetical protein
MLKNLIIISLSSSMLLAETFINPLPNSVKSIENGGALQAIDAYKDGIGVQIINEIGVATDNSPMNNLVFKFGEEAKANNVNLVEQVKTISTTSTDYEKALAEKISFVEVPPAVIIPPATNTCAGGFQGDGGYVFCSYGSLNTPSMSNGWLNLTKTSGYLYLYGNPALTNVNGLANLTSVGDTVYLYNNPALTNIDGLKSLKSVGGYLYLHQNPALTDISGLANLTSGDVVYFDNRTYTKKLPASSWLCLNAATKIYLYPVGYADATTKLQVCNP